MEPRNGPSATTKFHSNRSHASKTRQINFKTKPRAEDTKTKNTSSYRSENSNDKTAKSRKIRSLKSAQIEYHNVRQNKLKRKEEAEKKKEEIQIAMNRYNQKKKYKNRKLLAKTSKGQPIMKNRIELLLEKIRSSMVD